MKSMTNSHSRDAGAPGRFGRRYAGNDAGQSGADRRDRGRSWAAWVSAVAIRMASRLVNLVRLARLPGHRRNVRRSRKVLRTVRGFREPAAFQQCFAYLRQVEPLVFEDVVLSALEDVGLLVLRSRRYTGDGGIDGEVWLPGDGWFAVQVKRYRSYVEREHVRAFGGVVRAGGFDGGLFIHTGRSRAALYGDLSAHGVRLVSGNRLMQLVIGRFLNPWK